MRFKVYKLKNSILAPLSVNFVVLDCEFDTGMWLWKDEVSDYFDKLLNTDNLDFMEDFWSFSCSSLRHEIENYDLIEEFDNPKDSVVLKQIYEDTLFIEELGK